MFRHLQPTIYILYANSTGIIMVEGVFSFDFASFVFVIAGSLL